MPRIESKEVREIAQLARLRLDDQEVEKMAHDLDAILGYIEEVRQLDTTGVDPTLRPSFESDAKSHLRPDEVREGLSRDVVLSQAPDAAEGGLEKLPRVAERMTERLVRLAEVFQASGQVADESERREFPLGLQHAA